MHASRTHWTHIEKWAEIEAIISGQMWLYMAQGKGLKAGRILSRIRALIGAEYV